MAAEALPPRPPSFPFFTGHVHSMVLGLSLLSFQAVPPVKLMLPLTGLNICLLEELE
jgi:hypothetical protein